MEGGRGEGGGRVTERELWGRGGGLFRCGVRDEGRKNRAVENKGVEEGLIGGRGKCVCVCVLS